MFYSAILQMKFAVRIIDGITQICTEDKVFYTMDEINLIKSTVGKITIEAHNVKRMFDGKIINAIQGEQHGRIADTGTDDSGNADSGTGTDGE